MVGNIAAVLTDLESGLGLSEGQVGTAGGNYIAGACTGAPIFSYLTDNAEINPCCERIFVVHVSERRPAPVVAAPAQRKRGEGRLGPSHEKPPRRGESTDSLQA